MSSEKPSNSTSQTLPKNSSNFKSRWQNAYDTQAAPETLEGGTRQFNGYRHARTYDLLRRSLHYAAAEWHNRRILDAGCGSGNTGAFLKSRNHLTGLDFSRQMARYAREVYPVVTVADVERLPFADSSFDAVLAAGVWQCLTPETPFLKEVHRVLRPDGEAIFGWVLNADYLLYRRGVTFRLDPSVSMNLLGAQEIPRLLDAAGLEVIRMYAVFFPIGVYGMKNVPGWLRPLVPAFTVQCKMQNAK